jgi:exodeoxyribonuclease-3
MKLITWNVNGLRANLNKGAWSWVLDQKPDAVCLQEIKAKQAQLTEEQLDNFAEFEGVWNSAEKPGYSGVATFHRKPGVDTVIGLGMDKFDLEGRVIQTRFEDFSLFNVYFPSGTSGAHRVAFKLEFYEALLEHLDKLMKLGENIVLTGDFNTAYAEIDLARPKQNQKTSGFLPEEREMLGRYYEHGLVDSFRKLYPEKQQFSWWSARFATARENNIGWRLDYFLVSEGFFPRVKDVTIFDQVTDSDHCPVMLELK